MACDRYDDLKFQNEKIPALCAKNQHKLAIEEMVQTADAEDDSIFASERAPVEYKSVEKRSGANNSNVLDLGAIAEEEEEEEEGEDEPATTGGTIDLDELLGLPSSKPKKVSSGGVGGKTSLSLPPTTASVGSSVNASTSAALDDGK